MLISEILTEDNQATVKRLKKAGGVVFSDLIIQNQGNKSIHALLGKNGKVYYIIYPDGSFDRTANYKTYKPRQGWENIYKAPPPKSSFDKNGLEKSDYVDLSKDIEDAVGNAIPDGDPIDQLYSELNSIVALGNSRGGSPDKHDILNKSSRLLGHKSYNHYLIDAWESLGDPNFSGKNNPWKSK